VLSIDKKQYYCIFVDQFTKYIWLYTLKHKSEVKELFKNFQVLMERHFNTKILSLYTDGGGEYKSLDPYLNSQGIEHLLAPPYTPQRVALAERRHRHIIETARTLLHEASLPPTLWSFACQYVVYLINRLPTSLLQNQSPFQMLFGTNPDYAHLKFFGCLCYPWLKPYSKNKLEPRSTPCVYLGFSSNYHCYQCFDPKSSKIYLSRDVKFFESIFPFQNMFSKLSSCFRQLAWEDLVTTNQDISPMISPVPCTDLPPHITLTNADTIRHTHVTVSSGCAPTESAIPGTFPTFSPPLSSLPDAQSYPLSSSIPSTQLPSTSHPPSPKPPIRFV